MNIDITARNFTISENLRDFVKAKSSKLLTYDKEITSIKNKFKRRGSFEYSFSHFDLKAEIFFTSIKKSEISKGNWLKKNQYSKSGLPTVMKKIVEFAV